MFHFTKISKLVLRFGITASIGTAVGAGGVVIGRQFIRKNISEITLTTSTTQTYDDEINIRIQKNISEITSITPTSQTDDEINIRI